MGNVKVHVGVVFHHSKLRPQGKQVAKEFCDSWRRLQLPYKLVVVDNQSTVDLEPHLKEIDYELIRVEDQKLANGITGAWNTICKRSVEAGADIITGFADDVQLNETFRTYVDAIQDHNTIYAPLTNGVGGPWTSFQKSDGPRPGYRKKVEWVNGFWLGFTSTFWEEKNVNGELFDLNATSKMDAWAGQEFMMPVWRKRYGTEVEVVGDCWLYHTKLRSWKQARAHIK
jgi:hypothetical protein